MRLEYYSKDGRLLSASTNISKLIDLDGDILINGITKLDFETNSFILKPDEKLQQQE
jgi:hypothetical protein